MKNSLRGSMSKATPAVLRHTARDAELELTHLEAVFRSLGSSSVAPTVLSPRYWRARVEELDRHYMLLVPQRARVEALRRTIDDVETAMSCVRPRPERLRVAA